jgi:Tfp pilus assembly protein PilX
MDRDKMLDQLNNEDGAVLVLVLVVLVAAIIIGTTLMRSTAIETKIAGNERVYQQEFYACEAAGELTKARFDSIVSKVILDENQTIDVSSSINGTGPVTDSKVTITFKGSGNPPDNSTVSPAKFYANYYEISTTINGKTIRRGVWKAFPKEDKTD